MTDFNDEVKILNRQINLLSERLGELRQRRKEYKVFIAEQRALEKREAARLKSKLTRRQARALVLRAARGWTYKRIGQLFGVSASGGREIVRQAVWHIRRRKEVPVFHELAGTDWSASNCRSDCWKKKDHVRQCQMDWDEPLLAQ